MPNYNIKRGGLHDLFNRSRAKIQVISGGFGNGKTAAVCVTKALKLASVYPGSTGLVARSTYPRLNDTIRKELIHWTPRPWIKRRPTQDDNTLICDNESIIHFRYIQQKGKSREDGTTTSNLLSASYDWIVVDQIEDPEIVHKDFLDLVGRLRGATPYRPPDGDEIDETMPATGPRWLCVTCNPSQGWFYREVVQPFVQWRDRGTKSEKLLVDEETGVPIMELFEGSTYENKHNLEPDYIRTLESLYKGQMKERFIKGKWAAFEGLIHPNFDIKMHLITRGEAHQFLADCKRRHVQLKVLEAYDFGIVKPSCYLLAVVDEYSRVVVIDGFYQANFDLHLQVPKINEIRGRYFGLKFKDRVLADPGIFKKLAMKTEGGQVTTGETVARILDGYGLKTRPASNAIMAGVTKVNTYLAEHLTTPHLLTGQTPGPLIYFVEDLQFIQDEIGSYFWKKNAFGDRIDEPIDNNDHAMNDIKYLLSFRPDAADVKPPKDQLPPAWMFWHEEEAA